jgi:hypothetical protein
MQRHRSVLALLRLTIRLSVALAAPLVACASVPISFSLPHDHPASPCADEAPVPTPSTTLAVNGLEAQSSEGERAPDAGSGSTATGDHGDPAKSADATHAYTCPMHASVGSNEPGRCPKCGMQLKKNEKAEQHQHGDGT